MCRVFVVARVQSIVVELSCHHHELVERVDKIQVVHS